jgi:hypothetical protein
MRNHVLAIIIAVMIFLFVLDLVRRHKLTFKYACAWLFVSGAAIILAVFNGLLFWLSQALGFELPSNFIFFALFCVFVLLSLLLTVFLCQQNNRNDSMAQRIALLEFEIKKLKEGRKNAAS